MCQIWSRLVVAVGHPAGGANMAPGGGTKCWRCVDGVLPGSDHVSFLHGQEVVSFATIGH